MRIFFAFLLAVAVGCDGSVDESPTLPAATPTTPAPEPPPSPPGQVTGVEVAKKGLDFVLWTWDPVEHATGYEAAPYLATDPEGERNILFVEEPSVRVDGFEPNMAVWISVRAVRETAGGRAVGEWSSRVFAETWGIPPGCTDEREHAIAFSAILIEEWDGTPFLFHFDRDSVPEDEQPDAEYLFEIVERLSVKIEEQLGYSLLEVGGWTQYGLPCRDGGSRVQKQIVAYVSSETEHGNYLVTAGPKCADVKYYGGTVKGRRDGTIVHEIFHLFGFAHSPDPLLRTGRPHHSQTPPGIGHPMSTTLTGDYPESDIPATYDDINALRCIFPSD